MFGGVEKKTTDPAKAPFIAPPTARPDYEPPNVHDGYDKFIQDILSDGHCDAFQGPRPQENQKKQDRIQQFLKWSGIAFAVAIGGTILKRSFAYAKKEGVELGKAAVGQAAKHAKP